MKRISLLMVVTGSLALTGCMSQSVPRLKLTIDPVAHTVALSNPKDTTIKNFRAEVGTNGSVVTFDSLTTVMNPDVITTTGDAQAKLINATAQAVTQAVGSAAAAAAAAGLKP